MSRKRFTKKLFLIILIAFFVSFGCSNFFDAQAAGPVKWRFQSVVAPGDDIVKIWKMFAERVSKYSDGRLTFEMLLAGSSGVAMPQYVAAYSQNLVESGDLVPFMYPGEFGEWVGVPSLLAWLYKNPSAVVETSRQAKSLYEAVLMKRGIMPIAMLNAVMSSDGVTPIFSRKEIKQESDLKGLRIRVPGKVQEEYIFKKLGVNALTIPISEVYLAMSRGLCDAVKSGTQRLMALRLHEVAKYVYVDSYVGSFQPSFIVCSQKAYESLTPDLRQALIKAGKEIESLYWNEIFWHPEKYQIRSEIDALKEARSKGLLLGMLPESLIDKMGTLAQAGVQEMGGKSGTEGKTLVDIVNKALAKYPKLESEVYSFVKGSK
jgi:TRAP-type C4-dicarboxylate transport system substrate-binding protein